MNFDPFVIPFCAGAVVLFAILLYKYTGWINKFSIEEKKKILKGIFSRKIIIATKEVLMESLLHRKIFRVNPLLGYMHSSLAFGWFLLISVGIIEAKIHSNWAFNMPYEPIFYKFFNHSMVGKEHSAFFNFIMDFILLVILSGVALAFVKRFYSKLFGVKKTTKLKPFDKFALISLWCIFPLRFLAESFTSGVYHNGGFLTGSAGHFFNLFLPVSVLIYPAWWAYSTALCIFFISLPFSRYMHILTEVILIYFRNFGLKTEKEFTSFSEIEVNSCPRCGICIDKCQLASVNEINNVQSVYFLKSIRENEIENNVAANCLLCGRCQEYCPVGISTNNIRIAKRNEISSIENSFEYLNGHEIKNCDVIYFAGCMTHLTPAIKKSMTAILDRAKINYWFMDVAETTCCGRPLMLAGNIDGAKKLMEYNKKQIKESKAKLLVTSCPICYKMFKEDYSLDIEVLHHTQYLLQLVNHRILKLHKIDRQLAYHDPCELGRGSGIYSEPRALLNKISTLKESADNKEDSLCCGGSIGNTQIKFQQRDAIMLETLKGLTINNPDTVITSCPLCKKSFSRKSIIRVADISEVVAEAMDS